MERALKILKEGYASQINEVYLYGSCAREEARYDSDVDLAVFFNKMPPKEEYFDLKCRLTDIDFTEPELDVRLFEGTLSEKIEEGVYKCYFDQIKQDGRRLL